MKSRQDGFATIFVLMLSAALLLLLGFAMRAMYSAQKQNQKERRLIVKRAVELNRHAPDVKNAQSR